MTVLQLVDRERAVLRRAALTLGGAAGIAVVALLLGGGTIALGGARWIGWPGVPLALWIAAGAILIGVTLRTAMLVRRAVSRAAVASAIEREQSLRSGAIRGALEVESSGALGRLGSARLAGRLEGRRPALAPSLRRRAMLRGVGALGAAALALVLLGAARARSPDGWNAIAHPVQALQGTLLPPLAITGAPPEVLRGERVRLRISAEGRRTVVLHHRSTGTGWDVERALVSAGSAEIAVGPVDADLTLVAGDGRVTSDTVVVRVTDRPFVGDVALRAIYPGYLGRVAEILPAGEPARLPQGTLIEVRGRASTALRSVALLGEGDTVVLVTDGHGFSGRLAPRRSGRWEWTASAASGPLADLPLPLELEVIPDSAPLAMIRSPRGDTLVAHDDRIPLSIAASDDHGLSSIVLRSWRRDAAGRTHPTMAQRLSMDQPARWSGETLLDLGTRGLLPGDALHVVVVATDNSPWAQIGESRELVVRVPTAAELRAMARTTGDSAAAGASAAAAAQRDLERRTGEQARARGERGAQENAANASARNRERALSYEAAERARSLSAEQRQLGEQVQRAADAAAALEEQLRRAGVLDTALMQQLREAQQLLRDALTPELAERLRSLEQAVQQLSGDEARRSLAELEAEQRRLREALERSAEMLQRAALEGAMQTLADDARELARRERALADSAAASGEPRSAEAQELARRSSELAREMAELTQRLERRNAETGARSARLAERQANRSAEAMQRAAEAGRQQRGEESRAQQSQRSAGEPSQQGRQGGDGASPQSREAAGRQASAAREGAEAMERAAQAMADARAQQIDEWKEELTSELDRAIQETLQLSRQQQGLEARARSGEDRANLRPEQSAVQQGVDRTAARLDEAGRRSSLVSPRSERAMDEARREVAQATRAAEGRSGPQAVGSQQAAGAMRAASEALNRAASSLVRDRERAARASSASGFAEMVQQLQELAQQQGQLNAQASGLMQLPMGQQSAESRAAASALAQRQRELARQLDDVGELDGTGRAAELAREARQLAQALESGRIDAETLARQQRLFRRLLDAGRTLEQEEREESERREARAASGEERFRPDGTAASGRAVVRWREPTWDDLRGLTAEERRAVLEYFRRINAPER